MGDSLLGIAAPCFLLGQRLYGFAQEIDSLLVSVIYAVARHSGHLLAVKHHFLGHISVDSLALPFSLPYASLCPSPSLPRWTVWHCFSKERGDAGRTGERMGQKGPVLSPGHLWPGPGVLGCWDFRDKQKIKTTFSQNRGGGMRCFYVISQVRRL